MADRGSVTVVCGSHMSFRCITKLTTACVIQIAEVKNHLEFDFFAVTLHSLTSLTVWLHHLSNIFGTLAAAGLFLSSYFMFMRTSAALQHRHMAPLHVGCAGVAPGAASEPQLNCTARITINVAICMFKHEPIRSRAEPRHVTPGSKLSMQLAQGTPSACASTRCCESSVHDGLHGCLGLF